CEWTDQTQLVAYATAQGWSIDALEDAVNALRQSLRPGTEPPINIFPMGIDAAVFGHNAPNFATLPKQTQKALNNSSWESDTLGNNHSSTLPWLDLDNAYPVTVGDQVALVVYVWKDIATLSAGAIFERVALQPAASFGAGVSLAGGVAATGILVPEIFPTTVQDVQVVTRSAYLLASKLTSIQLASYPTTNASDFTIRGTRVLIETPPVLAAADVVIDRVVEGGKVMLDGAYLLLTVGQLVAVTGTRADNSGLTASEVAAIGGLELIDGYTVLSFQAQLTGTYVRSTVTVNANVAPATHGETTTQILGSGDASQAFQCFALSQTPLTYVSAVTPSGAASTLTVRVDGVEWTQVDWLYGSEPTDQVYMVFVGADGKTYVQFGDGVTGARPHSGTNNIVATYRVGIGSAGLARPGQVSTLLSRSLGLNAVTNPVASSGAADPETVTQARVNAPGSVMTIGRIVSLDDVAAFAAASAGIGKAAVNWVWDGTRFVACATVAGLGGSPVAPGTDLYNDLLRAMVDASDGTLPITLCSYTSVTFTVGAGITPDPRLDAAAVLADVKSALATAFSFDNRGFMQPVYQSEVIETVQNVPGVIAMTVTMLDRSGGTSTLVALPAPAPTLGPQGLTGAVLLTLEAGSLPAVVIAS
ncbi:MAG TPA: putative baseplate assembly protein, partial [Mycobacterium sp.]|nr:putative baseplate assembly protein [Mycobacterium sp.]